MDPTETAVAHYILLRSDQYFPHGYQLLKTHLCHTFDLPNPRILVLNIQFQYRLRLGRLVRRALMHRDEVVHPFTF